MGIFSRKTENRALKRPSTWPAFPSYPPPLDVGDVSATTAMQIADVYACVRVLADSAASLPLIAYRDLPDGSRERFSGRLADLIARAAPATTCANLVGTLVAHLNLHGNAYVGKYRDGDGVVSQLAPLDPVSVTVELDSGQPIYTFMSLDGVQRLTTADVLHIRALSIDGMLGISPIGQARQALGLAQHLASHADWFAKNAGRPGGVLRVSGWRSAQPGAAENIRSDWDTSFGGEQNAGKLLLLTGEGDIQYQQFALSMADAEFCQQRQLSTAEIARIFRIPPHLIGAPTGESLTYSNAQDQALAFLKFSLAPWLATVEQAISADANLSPSTVYAEFLVDGLLRADAATRAQVYTAALNPQTGWMTRDEVRKLENLPDEHVTSITPNPGGPPNA